MYDNTMRQESDAWDINKSGEKAACLLLVYERGWNYRKEYRPKRVHAPALLFFFLFFQLIIDHAWTNGFRRKTEKCMSLSRKAASAPWCDRFEHDLCKLRRSETSLSLGKTCKSVYLRKNRYSEKTYFIRVKLLFLQLFHKLFCVWIRENNIYADVLS